MEAIALEGGEARQAAWAAVRARAIAELGKAGGGGHDVADEPRDEHGRWTDGGGEGEGGSAAEVAAAHVRSVLQTGRAVAKALGYDASKVSIGAQESPDSKFTLNGKEYLAAGLAYTHGPNKGMIKLFPTRITEEFTKGVAAHEVEHQKFQDALDKYQEDVKKISADPGPPPDPNGQYYWQRNGGTDAMMTADGKLRPPYDKKYPYYSALHEAYFQHSISDHFAASDGVSDYSFEYWKGFKAGTVNTELAMHETLAEMGRIKYTTGKFPDHIGERIISYRGEDKPKPSQATMDANAKLWRDLYRTVEKVYQDKV